MYLQSLSLTGFRNLAPVQLELSPGVTIIHGENAAGKSNLLEGIALLFLARSPRGAGDQLLIGHEQEHYFLKGAIQTARGLKEVTVAAMRSNGSEQSRGRRVIRKITLDSAPTTAAALYDSFSAVTLAPGDTDIVIGPPGERRRFLDIAIAQASPRYLRDLGQYQRILAQKNAALKQGEQSEPFDELLIEVGGRIMHARAHAIADLSVRAHDIAAGIADDLLSLYYRPALYAEGEKVLTAPSEAPGEAEFHAGLRRGLERMSGRERLLRTSLVGPHRDDMDFLLAGRTARTVASQGQCRTAIVSAKLAQYDWLLATRGDAPVLLLDELFAEFDPRRTAAVMARVQRCEQLLVTTAGEPPAAIGQAGRRFEIERGVIR